MRLSQPSIPRTLPDAGSGPATIKLVVAGAGLAFVAALLLWWRFGPSVFVDALGAVWTCL